MNSPDKRSNRIQDLGATPPLGSQTLNSLENLQHPQLFQKASKPLQAGSTPGMQPRLAAPGKTRMEMFRVKKQLIGS